MTGLTELLSAVLNMSLTASVVVLVVLLARILLRRAPRWCSYALWSVVLFRLLCPVSVGSALSLLNVAHATVSAGTGRITMVNFAGGLPQPDRIADVPPAVTAVPSAGPVAQNVGASVDWLSVLAYVWAGVALAMLVWALVSYLSLRVRLWDSRKLEGRVYVSRRIDTAFVAGFVLPKIYLPANLTERERECVLAHERQHIRRCDHIIKPVAFIALCLHWFNPLVWLSWVLSMHDMESSCDEAALRRLGPGSRADYAQTLLNMATGRGTAISVSLSFGEDTKRRIKAVAGYRPTKRSAAIIASVLLLAVIAGCAVNPEAPPEPGQADPSPGTPPLSAQPVSPTVAAEPTGAYATVDDYISETVAGLNTVEYSDIYGNTQTANVLDTDAEYSLLSSVSGLAPEGTLESWYFFIRFLHDADTGIAEFPAAQYDWPDGYWTLNSSYRNFFALHHSDGSYDILWQPGDPNPNETLGFDAGYTGNDDEMLYDWYVTVNGLDYPLCVLEWAERINALGYDYVSYTVRRFDGDGWYLYLPIGRWTEEADSEPGTRWVYGSSYPESDSTLTVELADGPATDETSESTDGDMHTLTRTVPVDENSHWVLTARWNDATVAEYAYNTEITSDPGTARLAVESFTLDPRISQDGAQRHLEPRRE